MDAEKAFFLKRESEKTIERYTKISMGLGAIPIPLLDVAATTIAQVKMIKRLCEINGIEYKDEQSTAMIGAIASSLSGKFVASFVKAIPVVGWIFGIPAQVAASGILTYATGQAFMGYMSANKTVNKIKDFNIADFTGRVKDNINDGIDYVKGTLGKAIDVDVERKLRDMASERKEETPAAESPAVEADARKEDFKTKINELGAKIFENDDNFQIWLENPHKLSEDKAPAKWMKKGQYEKVISWLNVLEIMGPEGLDIATGAEKK